MTSSRGLFTFELMNKGAFFDYARKFAGRQPGLTKLLEAKSDKDFLVDEKIIGDFKGYLRANKIAFDEKKFAEAEGEIRRELEREINSSLWGIEEGVRAYQKTDAVVLKALEVMPEASKIVQSNDSP